MAVKKKSKISLSRKQIIALSFVLIFIIAIIAGFSIVGTVKKTDKYDFGKEQAKGYDISEHNGSVDFDTLSDEVDFVYIRVGYRGYGSGEICEDKCAKANIKAAEKAGIPFGVYFYSQAVNETEAREEAEFALKMIKLSGCELPVIIDFEYPYDSDGEKTGRLWQAQLSSEENANIVSAFCKRINKGGFAGGVYASAYMYDSVIKTSSLPKDTVIWVADYNKSVTYNVSYDIWQYSKTGESSSVESRYVDLNYWYAKKQ